MGYTTDFLGSFQFSDPLDSEELSFLTAFCGSRRMQYHVDHLQSEFKGAHGLDSEYGPQGAFFTKTLDRTNPAILDYNQPPQGQPSLYCGWEATATELRWSGMEKFYHYVEWLEYMITTFFKPWGIKLSGVVQWQGEDKEDQGIISVRNNRIQIHYEECGSESESESDE